MKVEILAPEALIDVQFSAEFYSRLQQLLLWLVANQQNDAIQAANDKIRKELPLTEEWEQHYFTLLSLVHDLEQCARLQNKITYTEIPDSAGTAVPKN